MLRGIAALASTMLMYRYVLVESAADLSVMLGRKLEKVRDTAWIGARATIGCLPAALLTLG